MFDMNKNEVKAILDRVLGWPAEAQQDAVALLRAIEGEWVGGDYHTTPEELAAIDEATDHEVEVAFRTSSRNEKV
jgi:hypothetical protein